MSRYSKKVKKLQKIQSVMIILCLIGIIAFFIWLTRPKLTIYQVPDACGPIGGQIMHSIDDEDACKNACNAHCQSLDKDFHKSEFTLEQVGCHTCDCSCKE